MSESESRDREGLGKGLSKLPKVDKSSLLASFVKQQQRNTSVYEVEGRKYLQTWGRERPAASSTVGSRLGHGSDGERRKTKEKQEREKSGRRTGIETPVLKPRNPAPRVEAIEKPPSRTKGKEDVVPVERAKAAKGSKTKVVDKGEGREKAGASKVPAHKANNESDSEADTETRDREHSESYIVQSAQSTSNDTAIGMNARKERRRERREIVNPKKRKDSPERNSEDGSKSGGDTATGKKPKKKGGKNKKQKIPAGLALMHGFSATNVGKSRLTVSNIYDSGTILTGSQMEPTSRPTGVFSKGKASTKTATMKKTIANTGFSELKFLNKRPVREKENSPEPDEPKHHRKEKAPPTKTNATSKKRAREPTPEQASTAESSSTSSGTEEDAEERPKRRPRSSSITWDIEHESAKLASTDLSVEIPLAQPTKVAKSKPPREESSADASGSTSSHATERIRSSLGPQDSASQCAPRDPSPSRHRPETDAFSKYFQQILEENTGAQSTGKGARTIPCPTFVAAVPIEPRVPFPPPLDDKEPSTVSKHQAGSQVSLWQMLYPNPPCEEKVIKDWSRRDAHEEDMEYEPWQENSSAFLPGPTGSVGSPRRYDIDSRQTMVPRSMTAVPILEDYDIIDPEGQQGYWEDTEETWEGLPAGQESYFDMEEGDDYTGDLAYGYFDEVGLSLGNEEPAMPWSVYQSGELYTGEPFPDLPECYGGTDPGSQQGHQMELVGSQQGERWQDSGPYPTLSDDEHEDLVGTSEPGASENTGSMSMQGLLSTNDGVCHFLQGRSALLGFDVDMGVPMPQASHGTEERQGASKVEIDVAKGLKNHWRPQRL